MYSESMTMNQFMTDMRRDLEERLSRMYPDTRVIQQEVKKVQGESYRGLMIRQNGHQASPVFNVEQLYDQLSSRSYESVLGDLLRQAVEHKGIIAEKYWNVEVRLGKTRRRSIYGSGEFPAYWRELNSLLRPYLMIKA